MGIVAGVVGILLVIGLSALCGFSFARRDERQWDRSRELRREREAQRRRRQNW